MIAKYFGGDLSTTGLAVGVQGIDGKEDFASVDMKGATEWHGQSAFDLGYLPEMLEEVLETLALKGWEFSEPGALSFSVRQHDMVILDRANNLLLPALSWQCNAAVKETKWINGQEKIRQVIGPVEERFILPKLMWALKRGTDIRGAIGKVITTGDYIAYVLTGIWQLSSSDAYCNGLLDKTSKKLAVASIGEACGFLPPWFPPVVDSGEVIGEVIPNFRHWENVLSVLEGWKVVSSLGDNHAGAVGCGLCSDETIVISAGTSGTIVRIGHQGEERAGIASCFEYYDEELLLMMMHRCASWYKDFIKEFGEGLELAEIDRRIISFINEGIYFSPQRIMQENDAGKIKEVYSSRCMSSMPDIVWKNSSLVEKAISVQSSIALELLLLTKKMLGEVKEPGAEIKKVVVTGGLSRSKFFQEVLLVGLEILQPGLKLFISAHEGPLAYKAAALGALINAKFGAEGGDISEVIGKNCPVSEVPSRNYLREIIKGFLQKNLS